MSLSRRQSYDAHGVFVQLARSSDTQALLPYESSLFPKYGDR